MAASVEVSKLRKITSELKDSESKVFYNAEDQSELLGFCVFMKV